MTERLSKGAVPVSMIVGKLLSICDPDRDTRDARLLFSRIGASECVWTGRAIVATRFDVDHVIPFALWRNNDLWNLLPAHPAVNNAKRDRLPSQPLLRARRDAIIGYWEALREHHTERFDHEAGALCGISCLRSTDWQSTLFTRLAEAVEITAVQRCVPRWEPTGITAKIGVSRPAKTAAPEPLSPATHVDRARSRHRRPVKAEHAESTPALHATPATFSFDEIRQQAYQEYLPVIGSLAAGKQYSGFDISDIESASECQWVAVSKRLAGQNRFVIRINGDSMEPELNLGDWVVFEYHRTPRTPNHIVIANLAELGITSDLTTEHAVKRLHQDANDWVFKSTNPQYDDIRVPKESCAYPILGIMVGRLTKE